MPLESWTIATNFAAWEEAHAEIISVKAYRLGYQRQIISARSRLSSRSCVS